VPIFGCQSSPHVPVDNLWTTMYRIGSTKGSHLPQEYPPSAQGGPVYPLPRLGRSGRLGCALGVAWPAADEPRRPLAQLAGRQCSSHDLRPGFLGLAAPFLSWLALQFRFCNDCPNAYPTSAFGAARLRPGDDPPTSGLAACRVPHLNSPTAALWLLRGER
jgi:hypothetical protein